jgi:phytoene dehydrogenase-like protein
MEETGGYPEIVSAYDAVVIGSGPNGLAAAATLAEAGRSVVVLEANDTPGGGCRSAELTLPGFVHDVCSAIHPLAAASPAFNSFPLASYGLEFAHPQTCAAHPLDDGTAVSLFRSLEETRDGLGNDGASYERLIGPFARAADTFLGEVLGPPLHLSRHPLVLARLGLLALRSVLTLAKRFEEDRARALVAGWAGHSMLSLKQPPTAAFATMFGVLAHSVGWPAAKGGSQRITDALVSHFRSLGGEILLEHRVHDMRDLPSHRVALFDVTPRQLLEIASDQFPARYRRALDRYRYGPGIFKMDWALSDPVPWKAAECADAGTVHVGGTLEEIAASEETVMGGGHPDRPFLILAQQSLFDHRAPDGKHTLWGYCHVPAGSTVDMTDVIERQIERFAPGFRDCVLERKTWRPGDVEARNANFIGGDINGGRQDLRQLLARPTLRLVPYSTPNRHIYMCSSSTPPGGGVHGMCGYLAARAALRREF